MELIMEAINKQSLVNLERFFNIEKKEDGTKMPWGDTALKIIGFILLNFITLIMLSIYAILKAKTPKTAISEIDFFSKRSTELEARTYLETKLPTIGATIKFIAALELGAVNLSDVTIKAQLNPKVFKYEAVNDVGAAMKKDSRTPGIRVCYLVASQYNGAESDSTNLIPKDCAFRKYFTDRSQGPAAQRMYSKTQVEIINNGAHEGYNCLSLVLNKETAHTVKGGYLIPATTEDAENVIQCFKDSGHLTVFPCITNTLRKELLPTEIDNNVLMPGDEPISMFLASTAALDPSYLAQSGNTTTITTTQKEELAFQTTLRAFRAFFLQGINLRKEHPDHDVILKPTGLGLGFNKNSTDSVAKAYYQAAQEYSKALEENGVTVLLQIRPAATDAAREQDGAHIMVKALNLMEVNDEQPSDDNQGEGGGSKED